MGAQTTTSQDPAAISKRLRPRGSLRTVPRGLPLAPRVVPLADRAADEAGRYADRSEPNRECGIDVRSKHATCICNAYSDEDSDSRHAFICHVNRE
jgi:hypothetical protein